MMDSNLTMANRRDANPTNHASDKITKVRSVVAPKELPSNKPFSACAITPEKLMAFRLDFIRQSKDTKSIRIKYKAKSAFC